LTPTQFALSHRALDASTVVVTLTGELELVSAPALKRNLLELRQAGHSRFVLDFSRVTFLDSTALSVLVGFHRGLDRGGLLALVALSPSVRTVFEVTGVDRVLNLLPTVEAALEQLPANLPSSEHLDAASDRPSDLTLTPAAARRHGGCCRGPGYRRHRDSLRHLARRPGGAVASRPEQVR
jgi:anti-sigma B factor antagonist